MMLAFLLSVMPAQAQPIIYWPDSSFKRIVRVSNRKELIFSGEFQDARITLENIDSLTIKNVKLTNCDVRIAGCSGHSATEVFMRGGAWNVFPGPVMNAGANNTTRWIGDNISIPSQAALRWRRIWPGGKNPVSFTVPMDHIKASEKNYAENLWKLRDSTGREFLGRLIGWQKIPSQRLIRVTVDPGGIMSRGPGFWTTYRPDEFLRDLSYSRFDVAGHSQMSIYFADGVDFRDSKFGTATLDYNLGFENCANVNLQNLTSKGNRTVQGNGVDVAFIFGIRGLTVRACDIDTLAITSGGWEVSSVDVDQRVSFLDWDMGWYRDIRTANKPDNGG
ncbi:MAG: hypothetical protein ACKVQS_07380 [Fimbriimonadaceae bacterium]